MNSVSIMDGVKSAPPPQCGDVFEDPQDGEIFILCEPKVDHYVAISLKSGGRWLEMSTNPTYAIKDLHYRGSGFTITLTLI